MSRPSSLVRKAREKNGSDERLKTMKATISAEVVNAFVSPLLGVFQATTGLKAKLELHKLASDVPSLPGVVVTINLSGRIIGQAIWTFEPTVARAIAAHMLASSDSPALDSSECKDAVGELANILLGNATDALLQAGFPVELSVPTTMVPIAAQKLDHPSVRVSVNTEAGHVNLVLAVTQT
jgi:chemotaxis protein CheX